MSSILKVDEIQDTGGNTIISSDGAGNVTTSNLADSSVSLAKLTATGTKDATTFLRGDNTFAEAGGGGGITEADMWRLTASQSLGTNGVISSNLERVDETTFAKIGTGMSVISGHWIFPSTGLWHVIANPTFASYFDGNTYMYINVSTDGGSTYDLAAESNTAHSNTSTVTVSAYTSIFVNVTNTSNYRVQFQTSSVGAESELKGSTNSNRTNFIFIRLGDSQ